ncbi:MAG: hypothetical protein JST91_19415 [Actinobacteria bacterium]|nr:hypothetical protein [Actinomycetota bacterium]
MLGAGVASADSYAGQKYSDVTSALGDAGLTGVIATREGDSLSNDDCIVTHSQQAPWIKGDDFSPVTDTVLLYLDCSAAVATASTPGNSAASPEGRAAIAAAKAQAAQDQATAAANQAQPKGKG